MDGANHNEVMTRLAVLEATFSGKFDAVISHLATLNGQTAKNSGAIETLKLQDKDILFMVQSQVKQEENRTKKENDDNNAENLKDASWKNRWMDLLFIAKTSKRAASSCAS